MAPDWHRRQVHLDVWSANLYPGRDFREFNFARLAEWTTRPFFVSEYGIDAYNINAPKCGDDVHLTLPEGTPCNRARDGAPRHSASNIGLEDEMPSDPF